MNDFFSLFDKNFEPTKLQKPLLKWAGGKYKLLPALVPYFKKAYSLGVEISDNEKFNSRTFFDVFAGSGVVGINSGFPNVVLGDKNRRLIAFHEGIKTNPNAVLKKINKLIVDFSKSENKREFYNKIREEFNSMYAYGNNTIKLSAYFWFLNKTCFNGMYREGKDGNFNIPYGERDCPNPSKDEFYAMSKTLKQTDMIFGEYHKICSTAEKYDFVYFDPPYVPISKTASFTSYTKKGFGKQQHIELMEFMIELSKRNVFVLMNNSNCSNTYEVYGELENNGFVFSEVQVKRTIAAKSKSRGMASDLIITNVKM